MKACFPRMMERGGKIINLRSGSGTRRDHPPAIGAGTTTADSNSHTSPPGTGNHVGQLAAEVPFQHRADGIPAQERTVWPLAHASPCYFGKHIYDQ